MTEEEFKRLEEAQRLRKRARDFDRMLDDMKEGRLEVTGIGMSTKGEHTGYGAIETMTLNNDMNFRSELTRFVREYIERQRDYHQRQFDEL